MDARHLDALTHALAAASPRRRLVALLAALPFLAGLRVQAGDDVHQDGRRKRRKRRHRRRKNPGSRKHRCTRKPKATICARFCGTVRNRQTCGKKVVCGPACAEGQVCQGGACGVACGSSFCPAASEICVDGACQACDVTCDAADHVCNGAALQTAIAAGGTVLVCAGRYSGTFAVAENADVTLLGAGMGDDPATATILDAKGAGSTLVVEALAKAALRDMRLTGASGGSGNAGLQAEADTLIDVRRCAFVGNGTMESPAGGLRLPGSSTISDSLISENIANAGGAVHMAANASLIVRNTTVSDNSAAEAGGFNVNAGGSLTLEDGCLVTRNATTVTGFGGGIAAGNGTTITISADSHVIDNTPDDCFILGTLNGVCGA